jgi:hypothetical protein
MTEAVSGKPGENFTKSDEDILRQIREEEDYICDGTSGPQQNDPVPPGVSRETWLASGKEN